jgi:hypothetical protein
MVPRPLGRGWLAAALFAFTALTASAVSITNVAVVNVTPAGFDVLWRAAAATPAISVFADPAGLTNLTGRVGTQAFPLHTGSATLAAGYPRRLGQQDIRQNTQSYGLAMVRVSGCRPATTYYYRLTSTPAAGAPAVYPTNGPLPSVTTPPENTFVVNDQILILDVPALDAQGRILTLAHTNATHPLAAVVGDGAAPNQAFFQLNDLFNLAGGTNFIPLGPQEFVVHVLGADLSEFQQKFTVNFTADFAVGQGTSAAIGTEFLALDMGSTVVRAGQNVSVPISVNTSAGVAGLDIWLDIAAGHLGGLALQSLAPELDPLASSVTPQGGTAWRVRLQARAGQSLTGNKQLALFAATALPDQISAFVPLRLTSVVATHPDATPVRNVVAQAGRVVIVAAQPLLEALRNPQGQRLVTLYGIPGVPYGLEQTPALGPQPAWSEFGHFVAASLTTTLPVGAAAPATAFFRALEFHPEPPTLDLALLPDGSRQLTIYGQAGKDCAIETTASLGSPWQQLTYFQLTNGLAFLNLPGGASGNLFYRVVSLAPVFNPDLPTLDSALQPDGSRQLTIYGEPGTGCALESTASLDSPWQHVTHFQMTNGLALLNVPGGPTENVFYRVVRFAPDPPVLDIVQASGGRRLATLYGQPWTSYVVEYSQDLGLPWRQWTHFPLTNGLANLTLPNLGVASSFYRAVRFAPDPPVMDALPAPGGQRALLAYGQPGRQYTLLVSTNVSQPVTWTPVLNYSLTNTFRQLTPPTGGAPLFYRLQRN